jgi:hypothetical protein
MTVDTTTLPTPTPGDEVGSGEGGPASEPTSAGHGGRGRARRWSIPESSRSRWPYGLFAVLCYLPMLLTKPGVVSDDTKTYLYLDPGRWTRAAASLWNPDVALGTVTHQNIGYLFPMGPFYWLLSAVHVPVWVAQRLWIGSILFAAAAGVLYLCSVLDLGGAGRIVAAIAYAFTPYVLQYAGRISVILLPFAGLPFLVAFIMLAVRHRGWRYPALFAIVVVLVSGINASSIIYVAVAPLLWLLCAVLITGEATWRQVWGVFWRTGLLSLLVSLWWLVGLSVEGIYGIDILKYTETVEAASSGSSASEVIRGLGYWYFYGQDRAGLWTAASADYTTRLALIAVSYVMPIGAIVSAALTRWRHRIFFILLVVVGLVLSVGPHPFNSPTPLGALDKAFMTKTTTGMALRSTDRATPLVVLGLAMLLGSGVGALVRRFERRGLVVGVLVAALVLAGAAPLLGGDAVIGQFSQPATLPSYVQAAADHLNQVHPGTRVYSLPGNNFAAYRWGDTIDPVWPGIVNRPYVVHEQFIQGSLPTANLLYALDNPLQQGTADVNALAPMLRLMSVGDTIVEYDQQYDRYNAPRPQLIANQLTHTPPGLSDPIAFGPPTPNVSSIPMVDETYFGLSPDQPPPHPLVVYTVDHPRPIVRAEPTSHALVVDGDAVGLVGAAGMGLLTHDPTIVYAGTLDTNPSLAAHVVNPSAQLLVTDTNRKQAFEWNSLSENTGLTETASETPSSFTVDEPGFNLFPRAPADSMTTSVLPRVQSVTASAYGTAFTLRSEFRPANAIDGDPRTAWETEGTSQSPAVSQWWQMTLRRATTADAVRLVQPRTQRNAAWLTNQWITKVTLSFDGGHPVTEALGPQSRTAAGQVVRFPRRTFRTMRIRIDDTNLSTGGPPPTGSSLVGFATVALGNIHTTQIVQVPSDLLDRVGPASIANRVTLLFTRDRVAPVPPRQDPEAAMIRRFDLPTARSFSLIGTARLSTQVGDDVIDNVVGVTPATSGAGAAVTSATSSSRMPGDLGATAGATLDHDPATVWSPGLGAGAQVGSWLNYTFDRPLTLDHVDLQIATDAEHSVPTAVTVSSADGSRHVALPHLPVTATPGSTTTVPLQFPALTGNSLRVTFSGVDLRDTLSYQTSLETALPIGIATVAIPGTAAPTVPATLPATCRTDLLRVDGRPVSVVLSGSTATALAGDGVNVALCGTDRSGLHLGPGPHLLQAADGAVTGINLDRLALDSAPGGAPMPEPGDGSLTATTPSPQSTPAVTVTSQNATTVHVSVHGATTPFLLVLGQSVNKGWMASVDGGPSLGHSTLVDGFGNGWLVDAKTLAATGHDGTFDVTMRFAPQRAVNLALLISGLTVFACVVVVAVTTVTARRRRRRRLAGSAAGAGGGASDVAATRADNDARVAPPADPLASPDLAADHARFASPFEPGRTSRRPPAIAGGALAAGLVALALAGPVVGAIVGVAALCALLLERGRAVFLVGSIVLMAVAALEVVRHQAVNRYIAGPGWPAHFNVAAMLVWAAVLLLAADTALEAVQARRARRLRREAAAEEN